MATFRLLHISDLHIGRYPEQLGIVELRASESRLRARISLQDGILRKDSWAKATSHEARKLEAVARFAADQGLDLDAIVITGDLASTGGILDLLTARDFVELKPQNGWFYTTNSADGRTSFVAEPTLRGAGVPIFLLPGNHDRFRPPFFLPGGTTFDRSGVFGAFWKQAETAQVLTGRIDGREVLILRHGGQRLVMLGADFCLDSWRDGDGPWGYLGQGKVPAARPDHSDCLSRLKALTGQLKAVPDLGVVWVVHFPPHFPWGDDDRATGLDQQLRLLFENDLVAAATELGISTVLAGHTHKHARYTVGRTSAGLAIEVFCAGTASQFVAEQNTVHILEISVGAAGIDSVADETWAWDEATEYWAKPP